MRQQTGGPITNLAGKSRPPAVIQSWRLSAVKLSFGGDAVEWVASRRMSSVRDIAIRVAPSRHGIFTLRTTCPTGLRRMRSLARPGRVMVWHRCARRRAWVRERPVAARATGWPRNPGATRPPLAFHFEPPQPHIATPETRLRTLHDPVLPMRGCRPPRRSLKPCPCRARRTLPRAGSAGRSATRSSPGAARC